MAQLHPRRGRTPSPAPRNSGGAASAGYTGLRSVRRSDRREASPLKSSEYDDDDDGEPSATTLDPSEKRATAVLTNMLESNESPIALETDSVYGAAILFPNIARSTGWQKTFFFLTMKVFLLLLVNVFLQLMILMEIKREQTVMDIFAGQMFLCDFGAPIAPCPEDPSCIGPGGTKITASRLYDFSSWTTRVFVRDSLKAIFPDHADIIDEKVDPGEYGSESKVTRLICSFIFILEVMQELRNIVRVVKFLYMVPTEDLSWVDLIDDDPLAEDTIDNVQINLTGIPRFWKIMHVLTVVVPKSILWYLTAEIGVFYILETADIEDVITNCVALTFVLKVDETLCATLLSDPDLMLLRKAESARFIPEPDHCPPIEKRKSIAAYDFQKQRRYRVADFLVMIPLYLIGTLVLFWFFNWRYYHQYCMWEPDGNWYHSKPVYLPETPLFSVLNLFNEPVPRNEEPLWSMPLH